MSFSERRQELLAFYESEHRNPANRVVHHLAHVFAVAGFVVIFVAPIAGIAMLAAALPMSWAGHFLFERNTPAFFDKTERGGVSPGAKKKIVIALGGIYWSMTCFVQALRR